MLIALSRKVRQHTSVTCVYSLHGVGAQHTPILDVCTARHHQFPLCVKKKEKTRFRATEMCRTGKNDSARQHMHCTKETFMKYLEHAAQCGGERMMWHFFFFFLLYAMVTKSLASLDRVRSPDIKLFYCCHRSGRASVLFVIDILFRKGLAHAEK